LLQEDAMFCGSLEMSFVVTFAKIPNLFTEACKVYLSPSVFNFTRTTQVSKIGLITRMLPTLV